MSYERLLKASADSGNWLTYSGAYNAQRFSTLAEIRPDNVNQLRRRWTLPIASPYAVETTPLVVDGTMYLTRPPNDVLAVDSQTGQISWEFKWPLPERLGLCCGRINRGVAILGDTLYLGTLDAHLVALDAKTGTKRWDVQVADHTLGFGISSAPLVIKDMVITGVFFAQGEVLMRTGTGEVPEARGHIDAYDAKTGTRRWRFYTVPGPGSPGNETWAGESWRTGGAPPWMTGSYDPELNLLYWGVGNPSYRMVEDPQKRDNLYSSSVVALDAATGRLRWHYQFNPHDVHDWDAGSVPVLVDREFGGRQRKLLLMAPKNGFFYALDRQTGEFLLARPFARQTWASGVDAKGRPILAAGNGKTSDEIEVSPSEGGASSWWSPSYNPQTGLFYVTARDSAQKFLVPDLKGFLNMDRAGRQRYAQEFAKRRQATIRDLANAVRAINPATGEVQWEFPLPTGSTPGILTTSTGLLFVGSAGGGIVGVDASNGRPLWRDMIEGWVHAAPITYLSGGRQFVSVAASSGIYTFARQE